MSHVFESVADGLQVICCVLYLLLLVPMLCLMTAVLFPFAGLLVVLGSERGLEVERWYQRAWVVLLDLEDDEDD
jgi:hypothetical protein